MVSPSDSWRSRVLSHVGGPQTFKKIGVDAGVASLFAIGGWLTSDDGPLKDAPPNTKRLVNLAFGSPMLAKLTVPELVNTWKEREVPDFVMHGLTTAIALLGAGTNDRDMINSAAMLSTLFAMAGHLEEGVQSKSLEGVQKLEKMVPAVATLHGSNSAVPVDQLKLGEHVVVKHGEAVPVDGVVSHIEVAGKKSSLGAIHMPIALDGEGKQMAVTIGGKVPQGALAAEGTQLVVETKALAAESAISRNIEYLKAAESVPGKSVHSVKGGINNIYVPIMLAACAAEFAWTYYKHKKKHEKNTEAHETIPAVNRGDPWIVSGYPKKDHKKTDKKSDDPTQKADDDKDAPNDNQPPQAEGKHVRQRTNADHLRKAVKQTAELAIKMAPCAIAASMLVLPFVKNALASSHGVMVREDVALEKLKNVTHVLTDIRGTLTTGVSAFKGLHLWDDAAKVLKVCEAQVEHGLLGLLGKAQTASTHEVAASMRAAAAKVGHDLELLQGEVATSTITKGVKGSLHGGHEVMIGGKSMFTEHGHALPEELLKAADAHGGDLTYFRHQHGDEVRFGIASFRDELRPGVKEAITKLREDGKTVVLVTGMPKKSAEAILAELEPHAVPDNPIQLRADCIPLGKPGEMGKDDVVREFSRKEHTLVGIGDGENDAPFMSLVKKGGGIAMAVASTGAAATKDSASMVIEGVHQLPDLIKLSKNMSHALWLNVGAAASWMGLLVGSHYAGYHMKTQTASVLHEAPTFMITLASLMQSLSLTGKMGKAV